MKRKTTKADGTIEEIEGTAEEIDELDKRKKGVIDETPSTTKKRLLNEEKLRQEMQEFVDKADKSTWPRYDFIDAGQHRRVRS